MGHLGAAEAAPLAGPAIEAASEDASLDGLVERPAESRPMDNSTSSTEGLPAWKFVERTPSPSSRDLEFDEIDTNKDDFIDRDEFRAAFGDRGELVRQEEPEVNIRRELKIEGTSVIVEEACAVTQALEAENAILQAQLQSKEENRQADAALVGEGAQATREQKIEEELCRLRTIAQEERAKRAGKVQQALQAPKSDSNFRDFGVADLADQLAQIWSPSPEALEASRKRRHAGSGAGFEVIMVDGIPQWYVHRRSRT